MASYHNVHTDQYQPDMILGSTENDSLRLLKTKEESL